jgi:hypothetical protein
MDEVEHSRLLLRGEFIDRTQFVLCGFGLDDAIACCRTTFQVRLRIYAASLPSRFSVGGGAVTAQAQPFRRRYLSRHR